jgi:hypothetical protein
MNEVPGQEDADFFEGTKWEPVVSTDNPAP